MDAPVLSTIEHNVRANPRACAVVDAGRAYSYAELATWSAAISLQLVEAGVSPGEPVGVRMPRGAAWIAAMLAVLRAGMVYVPLHPGLPLARRRDMCAIAGIRHVLARTETDDDEARTIALAAMPDTATLAPVATSPHEHTPAYLIFTSGTSGMPKAVAITHGNLAAHAKAAIARFALTPHDRVLQTCAIGFDISIEEVIPTLCAGAAIVVAPDQVGQREGGLTELLDAEAVTVANLPTALWSAWVDELVSTRRAPRGLRCLIVGGEACPMAKVQAWLALDVAARIACVNAYGPTETTITTTAWTMRALPMEQLHAPIGRALPGVEGYVLDETLQLAETGELYLGGALVGSGYRGQPAATAAVFLPDPFCTQPGARMYRSGDCVQRDRSDELVLSGRLDRQIKLRGHRIEPAEIERRLEASGLLATAAVRLAIHGNSPVLVAYVVPHARIDAAQRFHAADAPDVAPYADAVAGLPDYMQPRWYGVLDAIPLNANGKVDLQALPALRASDAGDAEPEDPRDHEFFACVRQSLGYLPENLSHSFHAAGGDSIQAVRLLSLLRQCGWQLDAEVLVATSLRDTAAMLRSHVQALGTSQLGDCVGVPLDVTERARLRAATPHWDDIEQIWPTTPVQLGMLYRSLTAQREGQYIEQVEGVLEDLDIAAFQAAWRHVIAQHAILRASFALALRDKPLLLIRRKVEPDWQVIGWPDDEADLPQRIANALVADRRCDFDLLVAPLLRFQLAQIGSRRHHFLWTYHHALLDGWSDVTVLDAVFDHYAASTSHTALTTAPTTPFAEYVTWLQRQDRPSALRYWHDHLAALPPQRRWLLADLQQPTSGRHARFERGLDAARTAALTTHAQRAGATLNTLLLGAWGCAVGAVRGTLDVVLGTVVATRPPELSDRIVGPLLNLLPLRLRLPSSGRVSAVWLAALQRMQAKRQPHLHLGLDQIAATDAAPLFDTLFVFENYPRARHAAAASLRSHAQTEYPLSLLVWPESGVRIEMLYDPALIDRVMLDGLWHALEAALEAFAEDPLPEIMASESVEADDACTELVI